MKSIKKPETSASSLCIGGLSENRTDLTSRHDTRFNYLTETIQRLRWDCKYPSILNQKSKVRVLKIKLPL